MPRHRTKARPAAAETIETIYRDFEIHLNPQWSTFREQWFKVYGVHQTVDKKSTREPKQDQRGRAHGAVEVDRHGRTTQYQKKRSGVKSGRPASDPQIDFDFYLSD